MQKEAEAMFQIVTDTSANLPTEYLQREQITLVPFTFHTESGEHACAAAGHDHDSHTQDSSETASLESDVPEVDEKAVLDFIHSRQAVIEEQRSRIRALEAQVRHLESQKALEEKKCAALRDALAKMRAEAKAN